MQTEVTITPIENTKRASVTGEAAVGETVQFRLKGCGSEFARLRLRIRVGRIDAAVFPRPDATPADIWRIDGNDAVCELSLATRELRLASVSRRSVRCEAIVDDGGEDTMLCSVPLILKVWRRGLAPLPEPSGPANDWKSRCDAIDEALRNESSHRVAGDEDLSERIDAIVVPEQTVKSVNGKTGDVVLGSGDIRGASGGTVADEIAGVANTAAGKYSKPSSGIPSSDLAPAVQAALSDARTPTAHASTHMAGGPDALSPASIGAAAATHAHGMSDVTGLGNALSGKASVADATLNGRGFSEWTYTGIPDGWTVEHELVFSGGVWFMAIMDGDGLISLSIPTSGAETDTEITLEFGVPDATVTATRTALPGYVLGNQTEKPLADADAVPAPSSATPAMDGTASPGSSAAYARADHVHPHDTAKQDALTSAQLANIAAVPGKLDAAQRNMLLRMADSANSIWLSPYVGVYRCDAVMSGTTASLPTLYVSDIPTASAYYSFEIELSVPSGATTLSVPSGWTWLHGGELPTDPADFAGKTIYIAARLDCSTRTVVANVWEIA